jgi:hypothetical protein
MKFAIGSTGTYACDHKFFKVCKIHPHIAAEWVRKYFPDVNMGIGVRARDLVVSDNRIDGWLNKLFIIVDEDYDYSIALYNHDGVYFLYRRKKE